jgi:hypothetical protein
MTLHPTKNLMPIPLAEIITFLSTPAIFLAALENAL